MDEFNISSRVVCLLPDLFLQFDDCRDCAEIDVESKRLGLSGAFECDFDHLWKNYNFPDLFDKIKINPDNVKLFKTYKSAKNSSGQNDWKCSSCQSFKNLEGLKAEVEKKDHDFRTNSMLHAIDNIGQKIIIEIYY